MVIKKNGSSDTLIFVCHSATRWLLKWSRRLKHKHTNETSTLYVVRYVHNTANCSLCCCRLHAHNMAVCAQHGGVYTTEPPSDGCWNVHCISLLSHVYLQCFTHHLLFYCYLFSLIFSISYFFALCFPYLSSLHHS